jgi:mannose-6-phosphate isomerase-like protein (cupin superfamily)
MRRPLEMSADGVMKTIRVSSAKDFFRIVAGTPRSQAATMALQPGRSTGGDDNAHTDADQWLYVIAGRGEATVEGRTVGIQTGDLLLIEAGEHHEIRNAGAEPLLTVNIYAPPEY